MAPLNLSRIIKTEDMVAATAWHAKVNGVKRERGATHMKVEPKTENYTPSSQNEFISPSWDTKSFTNKFERQMEDRKRKLSRSSTLPRRPQFPLAVRLHKYLMAKDPNTLSRKELDSLTWAESIIVKRILRNNQEITSTELPPIVKNPLNASISKTEFKSDCFIPSSLQLAIVDCGSPDRKYSLEQGKLIERAFNKAVVDHILSPSFHPTPRFGLTSWCDGFLILDCKDTSSYEFAKVTVNKIAPWKWAKLRAFPFEGDNLTYTGKFHAPDIDIEMKDIIRVLESQNPRINMNNWKVIAEKTSSPGFKTYFLAIAQPPVTFLQNKYLKLLFGASEVALEYVNNENLS